MMLILWRHQSRPQSIPFFRRNLNELQIFFSLPLSLFVCIIFWKSYSCHGVRYHTRAVLSPDLSTEIVYWYPLHVAYVNNASSSWIEKIFPWNNTHDSIWQWGFFHSSECIRVSQILLVVEFLKAFFSKISYGIHWLQHKKRPRNLKLFVCSMKCIEFFCIIIYLLRFKRFMHTMRHNTYLDTRCIISSRSCNENPFTHFIETHTHIDTEGKKTTTGDSSFLLAVFYV